MSDFIIREETPQDTQAIWQLTKLAFEGMSFSDGDEQEVVDRLRACGALTLSLVAEAEVGGEILGQITFSPAVNEDGTGPWYALGPVSVSPLRQGQGIGAALINEGLSQLSALGALGCILTGNPVYYRRFGFEVSGEHSPPNEPAEYFQLKLLSDHEPGGRFSFHEAFYGEVE